MSHFCVLVIGENPEEQLRPYQENNMGDCPEEYLEFVSLREEYFEDYKNNFEEMVKLPNGELVSKYDTMFQKPKDGQENVTIQTIPEEYEIVKIYYKDKYKTFEEFLEEEHSEDIDEKTGEPGHWENPNKKWDRYVLGGRWTGFFRLKEGKSGEIGRPGLFTNPSTQGRVDRAFKGDIDFEGMRLEAARIAGEKYDSISLAYDGEIPKIEKHWEEIRDNKEYSDLSIDEKREIYHSQPSKLKEKEIKKVQWDIRKQNRDKSDDLLFWHELEDYQLSREEFIEDAYESVYITYAVVKDGKWYEKGEMGWFGCSHNEKEENVWRKEFYKLLEDLPDDTLLSLYDCHI